MKFVKNLILPRVKVTDGNDNSQLLQSQRSVIYNTATKV